MRPHTLLAAAIAVTLSLSGCEPLCDDKCKADKWRIEAAEQKATFAASLPPTAENNDAPSMTGPQRNAVRSAKRYLDFKGFSRKGLIKQLSSDAGDGYAIEDATVAVDSLNVDWNEQAARSAESYLQMMGFSCSRLIEQLSSGAGDGFTVDQATFGATQAGAC